MVSGDTTESSQFVLRGHSPARRGTIVYRAVEHQERLARNYNSADAVVDS